MKKKVSTYRVSFDLSVKETRVIYEKSVSIRHIIVYGKNQYYVPGTEYLRMVYVLENLREGDFVAAQERLLEIFKVCYPCESRPRKNTI